MAENENEQGVEEAPVEEAPVEEAPVEEAPETFPRAYVEELRKEAGDHRIKAKDRGMRLHRMLVEKSGRLADASDLPFDEAHLDDEDALNLAIDNLLAAKPHLASRIPRGDVGQGASAGTSDFDLGGLLRSRA